MERFPNPPESGFDPAELQQLQQLGAELQEHCAAHAVGDGFADELRERLVENRWELRTALRERPLLRVAAALLVISSIAAPVSALVFLFRSEAEKAPEIHFELPAALPEVVEGPAQREIPVVPPVPPEWDGAFGLEWEQALAQSNRSAVVCAQWHQAFGDTGGQDVEAAPARLDWVQASLAELEVEFQRRMQLGLTAALPASLAERIELALRELPDTQEQPEWLQAWAWVLHGEGPPPTPQFFGS